MGSQPTANQQSVLDDACGVKAPPWYGYRSESGLGSPYVRRCIIEEWKN
jgi:hypothetical protein